ncbi:5-(carboxyamino)imidazole ribonucleotide synthase [Microbacterium sp. zg.B48]|uniref:5-(carboxyamino)imidazole ribonucleotide synthase n=1 Tax=unclassified Microbacterium TaxID=2609290 RepID=UPI00214B949D|nr:MULTISPECIES: 5-(carboxyamino)imidazole ribonucleotide synthase [unclassified Microbacterium]MCR2765114.1 5-(carboxyamino)imidazole ribonucleotide synthase [Microbacterium sp. zg.B48]MCR2810285.1 5-(carboxyamino)imidazole ribonucleotide synthase [Microbacterium sp. zg.B185]WIM19888.1 5-(carboxyamino)imidazole ribonucleotide synthase [Microbacterium sp. zg-B185]
MTLRVGVIGGGQLARMMIAPAVEIGIDLRVLAEQDGMAASLAATAVGDYRDAATVLAFARDVDVVTFDHEHVPQDVLAALVAAGVTVRPGPDPLRYAQDKLLMRARLQELGMPQPEWAAVFNAAELQSFLDAHGGRAVVKTPRGGYDGKGVRVVSAGTEAEDWFTALAEDARGGALLAEELVDFSRELAQQVARRPSGQMRAYPVVETVQRDGVCAEVIAPAPHGAGRLSQVASRIGLGIAEGLDVTGMLAVELFETTDERLLVNELAMRPHNSGHWTQDGAVTSQFEQHLRAVLDLPLGDAEPSADWSVMVNILGGPESDSLDQRFAAVMEAYPAAKVHTYGKAPRPGRKVGHVTAVGDDLDEVAFEARAAASFFED